MASFVSYFQLDFMHDLLQKLSSDSDSSSGDESGGEEEKKEDTIDEDDQAEQAKLPQYASRFKVGLSTHCRCAYVYVYSVLK